MTAHATAAGIILGTASYMSPDQARGKKVDRRADIWAFGVVLWEMLTGRKLFEGDTVSDVLASVLKEAPDLEALPDDTPAAMRRLLARCLERDPKNRLQWIGDARLDLAEARNSEGAEREAVIGATRPRSRGREWLGWLAAAAAVAAAAFIWLQQNEAPAPPLTRLTIGLGEDHMLSFIDQPILAISPDGRAVAMTASDTDDGVGCDCRSSPRLRRSRSDRRHRELRRDVLLARWRRSRILCRRQAQTDPVEGGSVVTLADAPTARGGVWLPDGSIVYSPEYDSGLWKVGLQTSGVPEVFRPRRSKHGERTFRFPHVTPDGDLVLFTVG